MNIKLSKSSLIRHAGNPREVASKDEITQINLNRAIREENVRLTRSTGLLKVALIASLGLNVLLGIDSIEKRDQSPIDTEEAVLYDEQDVFNGMNEEEFAEFERKYMFDNMSKEELDAYIEMENERLHREGEL